MIAVKLLRGGIGVARRSDAAQVRERRRAGADIGVQLGEPHDLGVGERVDRMRVLEGDDRLVDVATLRAKLAEDVVRAPDAGLITVKSLARASGERCRHAQRLRREDGRRSSAAAHSASALSAAR